MRILRVLTRLNVGGPARHALILHRGLSKLGHDCVLAAGSSEGAEGDLTDWDPEQVVRLPALRRGAGAAEAARATAAVRQLMDRFRPDIVHSHMAMAGLAARTAAATLPRKRRPLTVHTFHGHVLEGYFSPRREALFAVVERGLARWTDALIAVSPQIRAELLSRRIGVAGRWHIVRVGLELDELLALPPSGAGGPGPADGGSRAVLGIVGRLVPIKDHETMLQATRRLKERVPGVSVVVAGDGELRDTLEARTSQLGLSDVVEFRGWVSDLPQLYGSLDVVCLSSRNEGTPVALIEAMAAGRPVVATRVGGVKDVVTDGVTGRLVEAGDAGALAAAIETLLADASHRRELGLAARESVRARFAAPRLVADIEALYTRLLPA